MALRETQIIDGLATLPDRFAPRFEVFFAKSEKQAAKRTKPGRTTFEPHLAPQVAIAREKARLDGKVFTVTGEVGGPPPKQGELIPLAGPWGEKRDQRTDDILSVTFTESIEDQRLAQVDVQLHNVYDFERQFYRYTDIPAQLPENRVGFFPLVEYGDTLALRFGYGSNVEWVFAGMMTKVDVDFPEDGEPRIGLCAVDNREKLRARKNIDAKTFGPATEEEIVARVAREAGLSVASVVGRGVAREKTNGQCRPADQDGLKYITDRVQKAALEMLCFGNALLVLPPADRASSAIRYEYRRGLRSFKPSFNGTGKPTEVSVDGSNPTEGERFRVRVTTEDLARLDLIQDSPFGTATDKIELSGQAGPRGEVVTNYLARTRQEAHRIAVGILKRNLDQTFTVAGNLIGDPRVRPRVTLRIDGVGRYSGFYYVTSATHTFGPGGYQTSFVARRNSALDESGQAVTRRRIQSGQRASLGAELNASVAAEASVNAELRVGARTGANVEGSVGIGTGGRLGVGVEVG